MIHTRYNHPVPTHLGLTLLLMGLFLLPLPSKAQNGLIPVSAPADSHAAAALFVKKCKQIIPYYSAPNHFTIIDAAQYKDRHRVNLTLRVDADQFIEPQKDFYIGFFATPNLPLDIPLLVQSGYDLCMLVQSDKTINNINGYGGLMVSISNQELRKALEGPQSAPSQADMMQMGRDYLIKYARTITPHLPMRMGKGERFVQCYYSDSLLTMTLEYEDSVWPDIRQFLLNNMDDVRVSRAQTMVEDTNNAIAISALVSGSSVRHIYRNRAHTDSVDFLVTPWMLEYVYNKSLRVDNEAQALPSDYLLALAQEMDRRAPIEVDDDTRMVNCTYDSVTRMMTYVYEISDAAMLQIEKEPGVKEMLRQRIVRYFQSDDAEVKALVDNLIVAEATISYVYRSQHSTNPVVFTFVAPEIAHARRK